MDASSGGEEKWLVYGWVLKVDLLLCERGKSEKLPRGYGSKPFPGTKASKGNNQ